MFLKKFPKNYENNSEKKSQPGPKGPKEVHRAQRRPIGTKGGIWDLHLARSRTRLLVLHHHHQCHHCLKDTEYVPREASL